MTYPELDDGPDEYTEPGVDEVLDLIENYFNNIPWDIEDFEDPDDEDFEERYS